MVYPPVHPFSSLTTVILDLGDIEDLIKREKAGELFSVLSASFNTIGAKITRTVPNLKTFYLVKAKLHPAFTSVQTDGSYCLVEIRFDGTAVAFLGFQISRFFIQAGTGAGGGQGGSASVEVGIIADSMVGNGVKNVTAHVTNISGDFRIELQGIEETT